MKKLIAIIICFLCVISIKAQPKDGYYRIQNASSNNYVSIVNNKVDDANKNSLKSGGGGYVYSLRIKPKEEVVSDPGSIIYLKRGASGYILENQGMNTHNLTSLYLELFTGTRTLANGTVFGSTLDGAYWMYGSASGATRYVFETKTKSQSDPDYVNGKTVYYHIANATGNQSGWSVNDKEANWYFREIDNTNEYFGITPTVQVGDKWYGTIFCSFPFEVAKDMNAYYINKYSGGQTQAQIIKIEDGIVPANTAVIIECTSNDPANNIITLKDNASKSYNNILKGEYFCYISRKATNAQNENTNLENELKNAKVANNNVRVLGVSNGKLSMVKPTEKQLVVTDKNKYIPANTAYLEVSNSASSIELTTEAVVGISSIEQDIDQTDIFNLHGQKVASKGANIEDLPRGLYIINGKKFIKD